MEPTAESQTNHIGVSKLDTPKIIGETTNKYFERNRADTTLIIDNLNPWLRYFSNEADANNIDKNKLTQIFEEFTISIILKQWIFDQNLDPEKKPILKGTDYLLFEGINPARLVRYLVLQAASPEKIDLNKEQLTFTLKEENFSKLLEHVPQIIPGMQNLNEDQLLNILYRLGFKFDDGDKSYKVTVNQEEFRQMINQIVNTYSYHKPYMPR